MSGVKNKGGAGGKSEVSPVGEVRKSQALTTYGPGAMVDCVEESVLIGGLDYWMYQHERAYDKGKRGNGVPEQFSNGRLALRIAARMPADSGYRPTLKFREPPVLDDSKPWESKSPDQGIQSLLFPKTQVCNKCGKLERLSSHAADRKREHPCDSGKGTLGPIRFVGVCTDGHLSEIDWTHFVHYSDKESAPSCSSRDALYLIDQTGDLASVVMRCAACQAQKKISLLNDLKLKCKGHRPWLGREADEVCEKELKLQVRTASSSYFSVGISALTLPVSNENPVEVVLGTLTPELLVDLQSLADVGPARKFGDEARKAAWSSYSDDEIWRMVQEVRSGNVPKPELRQDEWNVFVAPRSDLEPSSAGNPLFVARQVSITGTDVSACFDRVVRVSKLEEIRAQLGFTRLAPIEADIDGDLDFEESKAKMQYLARQRTWLPATRNKGEGLFVSLREDVLQAWEKRPAVVARNAQLRAGYDKAEQKPPAFFGARYYLLHSLSHMLISAVAMECGYATSSIRERIYCSRPEDGEDKPTAYMAGILLSTTTPGAGGTLGGLVEQAEPDKLIGHLQRLYDMALVCSNDPVCASHDPAASLDGLHLEGAACHSCLFISEPSCERWNRMLDRALVVPTIGQDPDLAFFSRRPGS